jgi:hypothetical protein
VLSQKRRSAFNNEIQNDGIAEYRITEYRVQNMEYKKVIDRVNTFKMTTIKMIDTIDWWHIYN